VVGAAEEGDAGVKAISTEIGYEVGKFYRVPCIRTTKRYTYGGAQWLPIIGPEHSDKEFINFPASHWHIDWRFAGARTFKEATLFPRKEGPHSQCYSAVVQRWGWGDPVFGHAITDGEPVIRRMKCKRDWPAYPYSAATWLPALEAAYAGSKIKPGMICPHRGLPLDGAPRDGDVVTCPGHGLRWNFKTGELVT
jgi:hypothetical protein